jgi:hypothetical protein
MRVLKIIGHVILSVILVTLVGVAIFAIIGPPNPTDAKGTVLFYSVGVGALIAQWHRRTPIGRRFLSFLIFCVVVAILNVPDLWIPGPYGGAWANVTVFLAIIVQLTFLGTIVWPLWPIPFGRLWRGEIDLPQTYWVWITLVGSFVFTVINTALQLLYDFARSPFIPALKVALGIVVVAFYMTSVWRSARNYKGPRRWRILARVTVVGFAILTLVNLGGLLMDAPYFKLVATGDTVGLMDLMNPGP